MIFKRIILISTIVTFSITSFAQANQDSIIVKKTLGSVFVQNNKNLTPKQLLEITAINPEAYQLMQKAKKNKLITKYLNKPLSQENLKKL